jgi:hypothetical protein
MVDITATINKNSGTTASINSPTSAGPQKVSVTIPAGITVQNSALQLKLLGDVDTTTEGLADGSLLQYRSSDQKFVTRTNIITTTGNLTLNGGEY